MPAYRFAWANLPEPLLKALARDLRLDARDPASALERAYGALPTEDFVCAARPVLEDRWLGRDLVALGSVVKALWRPGSGHYKLPATRQAQLDWLASRNTTARLCQVFVEQLLAAGERTASTPSSSSAPEVVTPEAPVQRQQVPGPPKRVGSAAKAAEPLGFEDVLWKAADKLRGSMDASEYKHVVLGLIFLKYIDDSFSERRRPWLRELAAEEHYRERRCRSLWSPVTSTRPRASSGCRPRLAGSTYRTGPSSPRLASSSTGAMDLVEVENPSLRGVLPKSTPGPAWTLAAWANLSTSSSGLGLGQAEHREKDVLGRVYEYFLGRFASSRRQGRR